jgi:hypothetical protein
MLSDGISPHPSFHPSDAERIARDGTQLNHHQLPQRRLRELAKLLLERSGRVVTTAGMQEYSL